MCLEKIFSASVIGALFSLDSRKENFPLHARHIEIEQPAVLDNLPRDLVFTLGEFLKRQFPLRCESCRSGRN